MGNRIVSGLYIGAGSLISDAPFTYDPDRDEITTSVADQKFEISDREGQTLRMFEIKTNIDVVVKLNVNQQKYSFFSELEVWNGIDDDVKLRKFFIKDAGIKFQFKGII